MGMTVSVPRYTVADLERFPDDGNRYELLDGVLIVTPSPSHAHQIIANRLQFRLTQAVVVPGDGQVVGPGAITLLPKTQLEPDILVYPSGYGLELNWEEIDEHWLAVEVLSRSSKVYDREMKRDAYIALGVREVWLVDWRNKELEVSRARGPGRIFRDVLRWHMPTSPLEVEISLMEVFAGL